jgi:hypothetical protein
MANQAPCRRCQQRPEVPGSVRWFLVPGLLLANSMAMSWLHPGLIRHCCRECGAELNGVGMVATGMIVVIVGVLALVLLT